MKLETLCLMNRKFSFPARCPIFAVLPVIKLSIAMTRCPSAKSRSTKCEPRKPAPPVTTETGWVFLAAITHFYLMVGAQVYQQEVRGWPNRVAPDPPDILSWTLKVKR